MRVRFLLPYICVETLGTWGPSALRLIKEIGSKIAEATGEPRSSTFLMQSIGMAVQRGNAVSILGTTTTIHLLSKPHRYYKYDNTGHGDVQNSVCPASAQHNPPDATSAAPYVSIHST